MPTHPKVIVTILRKEIIELARQHSAHILGDNKRLAESTELEFWCCDGIEEGNRAFVEGVPFDAIRVEFMIEGVQPETD